MKLLENVDLRRYTTVKIGGTAKKMLIPENAEELQALIIRYKPQYFMGG